MMDTNKKSMLKTISWRVLAIVISIAVAYVFTGSVSVSLEIAITANVLSMIVYYFHERAWAKYE